MTPWVQRVLSQSRLIRYLRIERALVLIGMVFGAVCCPFVN